MKAFVVRMTAAVAIGILGGCASVPHSDIPPEKGYDRIYYADATHKVMIGEDIRTCSGKTARMGVTSEFVEAPVLECAGRRTTLG